MDIEEAKRIIEEEKKKMKKTWSTFEINVPSSNEKEFLEDYIWKLEFEFINVRCIKTTPKKHRIAYKDLTENFEREVCDFIIGENSTDDITVYLFISPELNPGGIQSKRYKYVGIMQVSGICIDYIWLHPFLRCKGLFGNFLYNYALYENILAFQPPFTKQFQKFIGSFTEKFLKDEELKIAQTKFKRRFISEKVPELEKEINTLNSLSINHIMESLDFMLVEMGKEKFLKEKDVILATIVKAHLFIKEEYPEGLPKDVLEEISQMIDVDNHMEKRKRVTEFGFTEV